LLWNIYVHFHNIRILGRYSLNSTRALYLDFKLIVLGLAEIIWSIHQSWWHIRVRHETSVSNMRWVAKYAKSTQEFVQAASSRPRLSPRSPCYNFFPSVSDPVPLMPPFTCSINSFRSSSPGAQKASPPGEKVGLVHLSKTHIWRSKNECEIDYHTGVWISRVLQTTFLQPFRALCWYKSQHKEQTGDPHVWTIGQFGLAIKQQNHKGSKTFLSEDRIIRHAKRPSGWKWT